MASNFQQNDLLGSDEDGHIEEAGLALTSEAEEFIIPVTSETEEVAVAFTSETEEVSVPLKSKIGDDTEPINEEASTSKEESKLQQQVQKKFCVFLMSNLPNQDLLSQTDNFPFL